MSSVKCEMPWGFWAHLLSWARIHLCGERTALHYFLGARRGQRTGSSTFYPALCVDSNFCIFQYFALVGTDVDGNQPKIFYTEVLISPQTWKTCDRPEVLGNHTRFISPTQPEIF